MALQEDAFKLVLEIYRALCSCEYDHDKRSDYTLIHHIDMLVTEFVESKCKPYIELDKEDNTSGAV